MKYYINQETDEQKVFLAADSIDCKLGRANFIANHYKLTHYVRYTLDTNKVNVSAIKRVAYKAGMRQKSIDLLIELLPNLYFIVDGYLILGHLNKTFNSLEARRDNGRKGGQVTQSKAKSENVSKTDTPKTPKAIETVKEPTQKPMYTFQNPPKKTAQYYKDNKAKAPVTQKEREFTTEPILVTMDDKKALAVFRRENSLEQWNTFLTNRDATTVTKDYWENATASGLMAGEYWNWKVNGIVPNKEACKSRVTYNKR